jgi:hypothetical protein
MAPIHIEVACFVLIVLGNLTGSLFMGNDVIHYYTALLVV